MLNKTWFYPVTCLCAVLLIDGCAAPPPPARLAPAFDPAQFSGGEIYEVIPGESRLVVKVYRGGAMARLGHNHIISTADIRGRIYRHPDPARSGVVLQIPVESFEVDNAELRRADPQTFDTEPDREDIAGTRRNMLSGQLLDAEDHPDILIRSVSIGGPGPAYEATLRITLRGHRYDARVPIRLDGGADRMTVRGNGGIRQSDLGLEPYNLMMGALRVRDEMDLEFAIVAGKPGP